MHFAKCFDTHKKANELPRIGCQHRVIIKKMKLCFVRSEQRRIWRNEIPVNSACHLVLFEADCQTNTATIQTQIRHNGTECTIQLLNVLDANAFFGKTELLIKWKKTTRFFQKKIKCQMNIQFERVSWITTIWIATVFISGSSMNFVQILLLSHALCSVCYSFVHRYTTFKYMKLLYIWNVRTTENFQIKSRFNV